MTITKIKIVQQISREQEFHANKVGIEVDKLITLFKKELEHNDIMIKGLGKFVTRNKKERLARNLITGVSAVVKARKVVNFIASRNLKKQLQEAKL